MISRREFFDHTGKIVAGAALTIVPAHVLGAKGKTTKAPSNILTQALIGSGSQGRSHINGNGFKCLAVCDVDEKHLEMGLKKAGKDAKGYKDWREVLLRKDIDVIDIATPPHWHAIMIIAAANAGFDIWSEKPMTRTIGEGIKAREAIQKNGSIFRINTFFRYRPKFYGSGTTARNLKKLVRSNMLGWPLKVTLSKATGFNWKLSWSGRTSLKVESVPKGFDYNMWLGPAPWKPYNPHRVHRTFRGYWDYDGGGLGDMGQHYLDPIQYILGKDDTSPIEIAADAPQQHPDAVGQWRSIEMKYTDGCRILLDAKSKDKDAAFIEGPEGKIFKGFRSNIPNLREKLNSIPDVDPVFDDFIEAVKTRKKFCLNEGNGHRSCSLVNLSKIAVRLGRKLKYDPVKEEFINDEGANRLINQPARAPWYV